MTFGTSGRISAQLAIGLALAILLDTAVQTVWKRAADALPDLAHFSLASLLGALLHTPLFLVVGVLIAAQMFNWLKTLDHADVSFALPITALSYISVALVSAVWLHETITWQRMAGMALVLAGVYFVARSDPNSTDSHP